MNAGELGVVVRRACALLVLVSGCNVDWTVRPEAAGPLEDAGSWRADGVNDAGLDGESPSPRDDAGIDAGDAGDAGDVPDSGDAGCSPSRTCAADRVCTYPDHYCGSGGPGVCVERSSCAGDPAETVCGCDGNVYSSRCAATQAGADPSIQAPCTPPAATFRCGDIFCSNGDACTIKASTTYKCKSLSSCALGCACPSVLLGCAGGSCAIESGHVVLRCP